MNLSTLLVSVAEARTIDWLASAAGIVAEAKGKIYSFDYPNYNLDRRPRVLVLGTWLNPETGNRLLGGLNLNYLTDGEAEQVHKVLPLLLRPRSLRDRYRLGTKLLPDIFKQLYRTYDLTYVKSIDPAEFTPEGPTKGTTAPSAGTADSGTADSAAAGSGAAGSGAAIGRLRKATPPKQPTTAPKASEPKPVISPPVAKPKPAAKPKPKKSEPKPTRSPATRKDQRDEPATQVGTRGDKEPDSIAGIDDVAAEPETTADALSRPPRLGNKPPTTEDYRHRHRPDVYVNRQTSRPLLAVHNVRTGETLIDRVNDHAVIITEAGWRYRDVLRLLPVRGQIAELHDCLTPGMIDLARRRIGVDVYRMILRG